MDKSIEQMSQDLAFAKFAPSTQAQYLSAVTEPPPISGGPSPRSGASSCVRTASTSEGKSGARRGSR